MSVLGNTTKDCFRQIKAAILDKIIGIRGEDGAKVMTRFRYADNLDQWLEMANVEIGGEQVFLAVFIYLTDFSTAKKEIRSNAITANFAIEVVRQFADGDEETNSTTDFEDFLGDINDLFLDEESLGFTDTSSNEVLNNPLTGEPGDGRPALVDGVLAHRKILNLGVTFRICKGGN